MMNPMKKYMILGLAALAALAACKGPAAPAIPTEPFSATSNEPGREFPKI